MATRKTHTSTEVKERYNKKTYARFAVSLRKEDDRELIQYIKNRQAEGASTTEIFREALNALVGQSHLE